MCMELAPGEFLHTRSSAMQVDAFRLDPSLNDRTGAGVLGECEAQFQGLASMPYPPIRTEK